MLRAFGVGGGVAGLVSSLATIYLCQEAFTWWAVPTSLLGVAGWVVLLVYFTSDPWVRPMRGPYTLSPRSKRSLFLFLLALHLLGAYPLAWAFFEEPITILVGWNVLIGVIAALIIPRGGISIQRGMGYLIAMVAVLPFAGVVWLGYGISVGLGKPMDPSMFSQAMATDYHFPLMGFRGECYLRAIGALIGSYLAGALALRMAEKGFRSGRRWLVMLALFGECAALGLLFHFLIYRIDVDACHIVEDAGKNRTLADVQSNDPGWVVLVVSGRIPITDVDEVTLRDSQGWAYPMAGEYGDWVLFALPPDAAKTGELTLRVRGLPNVLLPDGREMRRGDELPP
jgi:hypothetical protein